MIRRGGTFRLPPRSVLLRDEDDAGGLTWQLFVSPKAVVQATRVGDVLPAVEEIERAVGRGLHAVGFVAYEAAPAFDRALAAFVPADAPLLWFGLYREAQRLDTLPAGGDPPPLPAWTPELSEERYRLCVERIREYIAAGDTYQVNLTQRLRADFAGDVYALFLSMQRAQPTPFAACLDLGDRAVACHSPELFFRLDGRAIASRPMKGTIARGRWNDEDREQAAALAASTKDRAENAMIVDMVRNDLGRIAEPGSVEVRDVFRVERYRTLFQMTSTVLARTDASFRDILTAMFPCASITGAPKVRTTEIIRELEVSPRGVYTGCIGRLSPGRRARFNVAIRTAVFDRAAGRIEYGTGGGITWDSIASKEADECRLKAGVAVEPWPAFSLTEALLWTGRRYRLRNGHLRRLQASADYFDYRCDRNRVARALHEAASGFGERAMKVRLLLSECGEPTVEAQPLEIPSARPTWNVAIAPEPVNSNERFLFHKTTHRRLYDSVFRACPGYDDVLLWNAARRVTESARANVVLRIGNRLVTPPVSAGLLPGVFRDGLLRRRCVWQRDIDLDELARADAVYLVNSVRGWIGVRLFDPHGVTRSPSGVA